MFEIAIIAIIVLFVIITKQQKRLNTVEADLRSLRKVVTGFDATAATASVPVETAVQPQEPATPPEITEERADASDDRPAVPGPWAKTALAASTAPDVAEMEPAAPAVPANDDDILGGAPAKK